ncbi:MAG: Flp family type IVb pilin [Sphingomonas sp.]|nr:Flp family type IVb pilin [Sphingomonas sp.]
MDRNWRVCQRVRLGPRRRALWSNQSGAAVIEYAMLASLIAIAISGAMLSLGGGAGSLWGNVDRSAAGTTYETS